MRPVWIIEHDPDHGHRAVEHTRNAEGDPETPTGRTLGPFPSKPDLEAALMKAGVGFMDYKEI